MLFYLSEENEDVLQKYHYSHDRIKERLAEIAEKAGIADMIKLLYL